LSAAQTVYSLSHQVKTNACFAAACFPADGIYYIIKQ
jgi:hypothetical protein